MKRNTCKILWLSILTLLFYLCFNIFPFFSQQIKALHFTNDAVLHQTVRLFNKTPQLCDAYLQRSFFVAHGGRCNPAQTSMFQLSQTALFSTETTIPVSCKLATPLSGQAQIVDSIYHNIPIRVIFFKIKGHLPRFFTGTHPAKVKNHKTRRPTSGILLFAIVHLMGGDYEKSVTSKLYHS